MSRSAVAGDSVLLGYFKPGFAAPTVPSETVIVGVTDGMAMRSRYIGAEMWMEEHGALAVFYDPETGVCYAQGAGG